PALHILGLLAREPQVRGRDEAREQPLLAEPLTALEEVVEQHGAVLLPLPHDQLARGSGRLGPLLGVGVERDAARRALPPPLAADPPALDLADEAVPFELAQVVAGRSAGLP